MGTNILLSLIVGVAMTAIVGSQIGPNYIEQIKIKKVQTKTINNQEIIFEGIKRYVTIKQIEPNSLQDVINAGYLNPNVNDNGFTGGYTIDVDKALGVATITTTIADPKVQEAFLNSFTGTSKPTRLGTTNNFETKFVLPNEVMHGNALLMTGIPIQATPPTDPTQRYWYDTSSGKATLKLYDGTNWIKLDLGGSVSIGSIETFAGVAAKIPEGYLLCNGQEVSRTTYKDLFDVIGTTYGSTTGTTFKVPDLRGEFIRGFDGGRGVDSGRTFGSWQKGTANAANDKYEGHGIIIEANAENNLQLIRESVGLDKADYIHYTNIRAMFFSASTGIEYDFMNNPSWGGGTTRPRNVAMNYIIKY
ncbi:phage tail protein [Aliarcobacter butzleri]|uniref:phage tail protein n=1 Tax=Aliarcobacter butzleri TaxID=28197 RepID=UPI00125F3624|nr:phage tail protein [Aliarcobacter butzleri]